MHPLAVQISGSTNSQKRNTGCTTLTFLKLSAISRSRLEQKKKKNDQQVTPFDASDFLANGSLGLRCCGMISTKLPYPLLARLEPEPASTCLSFFSSLVHSTRSSSKAIRRNLLFKFYMYSTCFGQNAIIRPIAGSVRKYNFACVPGGSIETFG